MSRPGYPEKSPSVVPKADATAKTLRHQGQCVASAKKTGRRCEAWTLTGGSFCFHHAAETLEEANGGPVVTAAEKRASILQGALHGMRRGPASIDLAQAIDLKIDTLEEIRAVRQVLFQELRARPWSHGDAQDQLQLLAEARRGAVDLEKLRQARAALLREPRTRHVRITLNSPWRAELAKRPRRAIVAKPIAPTAGTTGASR